MSVLSSGLPEHIDDEENLARFLTSSSHFNSIMVKAAAFFPNPSDGQTSVSRHGAQPSETLWEIGSHAAGTRTLHGAAIFKAQHVREAMLDVLAKEPPPRHANITNWPTSAKDSDLERAQRKECALILARHAILLRR
jgi:hypothetical protein